MRGQKRVEDARRRAGVQRIHVFWRKWRRGWPGQARPWRMPNFKQSKPACRDANAQAIQQTTAATSPR